MAHVKVLLYKSKKRKDGTYPIVLRITINRKPKYIFLKQYIKEFDWDDIKCRVRKSHPNSKRLNNYILNKLSEADDLIMELESKKEIFSSDQIKKKLTSDKKRNSFFEYAQNHLSDLEKQGKFNQLIPDRGKIRHFREFVKNKDVCFEEITVSLLKKYKVYLKATYNHSERTIMNHLTIIRTIYNNAIKDGAAERNYYPFGGENIKIKMTSSMKLGLDKKELEKIEKLSLKPYSSYWHTRNVFLFSFYFAGMRISDVLRIKWIDIQNNRLNYVMGKNNKSGSIKVSDKAQKIINYYKKDKRSNNDFLFPELKKANLNSKRDVYRKMKTAVRKFNRDLKEIASLAKIDKNISNHIARHTFGNIAGDKIPVQMLQKLYRHSDIQTTIIYQSNFIYKDTDDALDAVIGNG